MGASAELVGSAMDLVEDFFAEDVIGKWIGLRDPLSDPEVEAALSESEVAIAERRSGPEPAGLMAKRSRARAGG